MRRINSYLAALAIAAGLVFTGATPANAASCTSTNVCFWQYSNYGGFTYKSYLPNPCLNLPDSPVPMNNNATSIIAGSQAQFLSFYNAQNCQGTPVYWMWGGDSINALPANANNVITSFRRSATP